MFHGLRKWCLFFIHFSEFNEAAKIGSFWEYKDSTKWNIVFSSTLSTDPIRRFRLDTILAGKCTLKRQKLSHGHIGLHACGMVPMPQAWSPCLRHGFHASRNTPLLLLTYFAFLVFFAFFAFFATLTL